MLFGNPSNATNSTAVTENYLIDKKYYVVSYSSSRATPNWVSWHLDETYLGSTPRQDNFAAFLGLPTGYYQVQSNSYSGSGFDRGHNCPSADRTSSVEANSSTFLMTNMIPQAPQNNQRTWADVETLLRAEVNKGYEVYTIMGSYGKGGIGSTGFAETINNGKVTVPKRVWKIAIILPKGNGDLARTNADTRILAIDTPNENTLDTDWKKYITTVDAIEKATGYDLLSKLSTDLQKKLQSKIYVP
jgi:endonuclease G